MTWDDLFMELCAVVAKKSKDKSTKIGAFIMGPDHEPRGFGFNGFARGVNDDIEDRHQRPAKYDWTIHAEANAICNAARVGIPLKGCTLFCAQIPCSGCTDVIIQAGITEVVVGDGVSKESKWEKDASISKTKMKEASIILRRPNETRM